jgi:spore maturation protein CgeB
MVSRVIRRLSTLIYKNQYVAEDVVQPGAFGHLKIALVTDHFTADCLSAECRVRIMTPGNFREVIREWKPDLVFVESAFHGVNSAWRYELVKQSKWLRVDRLKPIFHLIEFAKNSGIPTVFWNKDDGAYFDDFIDIAKDCDLVLTTDQDSLSRYEAQLPKATLVHVMQMPYQPAFHFFSGFHFTKNHACFVGSYYSRVFSERRNFLDMLFKASLSANMNIEVYDRNYYRVSRRFAFHFPKSPNLIRYPAVSNRETGTIYKTHSLSINVNSVVNSETMVSRRLLEILACGGIALTNPSKAVTREFAEFCLVVSNNEEAKAIFERMQKGPSINDLNRASAGAEYVRKHHTWAHRLTFICDLINL